MPEDYLRDLWTQPLTDRRKEALRFAAETEDLASHLPGEWLGMITTEDHKMLRALGISIKC